MALHVADGSQIISRRAHGRHLTIGVGLRGRELYGSCLRRLDAPTLAEGHLPILQTSYVDRHGVRYSRSRSPSGSRRRPRCQLRQAHRRREPLEGRARSSSPDAVRGGAVTQGVEADARRTHLHVLRPGRNVRPPFRQVERLARRQPDLLCRLAAHTASSDEIVLDELRYEEALSSLRSYWERRLAHGARIVVPEQAVMDAQRNLLIQNLALTWRYSVGNRYEQLSTPEGVDVARVLTGYGHLGVGRSILRTSLRKKPTQPKPNRIRRSTNWRMGARLVGFASYARLSGDTAEILRDARAAELCQAVRTPTPGESLPTSPARALLIRRLDARVRPPFANRCVAGPPLDGAGVGGHRVHRLAATCAGSRASSRRGSGEPLPARSADCRAGRCSSRSRCSTTSGPTGRSRHRAVGATGTSSCPMRSHPASSSHTARRRRASSPTSAGTAPACSGAFGPAHTVSTGRRLSEIRLEPRVRTEPGSLPGRQRPARSARARPLRTARPR